MTDHSARQVITSRQLFYLLCAATFPTEVMMLPGELIGDYGKDALWSILIGALFATLPLLLALGIVRRTQGRTLTDVLKERAGLFGRIVLGLLGLDILLVTVNLFGDYVQYVYVALLVRTPPWAILALGLAVVLYGVTGGMEVLGRLAEILIPVALGGAVILWLLALPWYRIGHLLPVWPQRLGALGAGGYHAFAFLAEIAFASYLGGFARDPAGVPRALWLALAVNSGMLLLFTAMPLLMFSEGSARLLTLPPVIAVRAIHYGFLIERLDTLTVPAWVFFVSLKIMLWAVLGAQMLATALGLQNSVRLSQIGAAITAVWSLRFASLVDVLHNVRVIWYDSGLPLLLLALLAMALICRGSGRSRHA